MPAHTIATVNRLSDPDRDAFDWTLVPPDVSKALSSEPKLINGNTIEVRL